MIIVLPLGHEKMEAQRLPYITIGIVILNLFIFITTHYGIVPRSQQERFMREMEVAEYYIDHSYLDFPEETYDKLSPWSQEQIEYIKQLGVEESFEDAYDQAALTERVLDSMGTETEEDTGSRKEMLEKIRQEQQARLDELVQAFERAYGKDFYMKYGYVPSKGGVFPIFSSMFLHGGILHLVFNMLFLWLSGCNIEDLWGRIIYPIFYLFGGIAATLAHGMMFPESPIPLIGASGAIAAVILSFGF